MGEFLFIDTDPLAEAELDLDAIEARANAATDGPWEHGGGDGLVWPPRMGDPVSTSTEPEDADFIAAARSDVPALVAEVRRLRAVLTEAQRMAQAFDTPRDSGRVRVFVGDLRHVLHKGLEGDQ